MLERVVSLNCKCHFGHSISPFFHFRLSALKSIKSPEKMIPASNKGLELGVINQDVWVMSLKLNPLYNQSQCEKGGNRGTKPNTQGPP